MKTWPLKPVSKIDYYKIINKALYQLGRPDLINKVKIVKSKDRVYDNNVCVIGNIPYLRNQPIPNKIILYKHFWSIQSEEIRKQILQHETTHIVDLYNRKEYFDNNFNVNCHDDVWRKLMNTIDCKLYSVDYSYMRIPSFSYKQKKRYKYYDYLMVEK